MKNCFPSIDWKHTSILSLFSMFSFFFFFLFFGCFWVYFDLVYMWQAQNWSISQALSWVGKILCMIVVLVGPLVISWSHWLCLVCLGRSPCPLRSKVYSCFYFLHNIFIWSISLVFEMLIKLANKTAGSSILPNFFFCAIYSMKNI